MREIKFRAWNKVKKFMLPIFSNGQEDWYLPSWKIEWEVMQYTGLQDRNGKEIYEGDVLSNGQHINWIVDYHVASFVVKHVGSITEDSWVLNRGMAESREVIGNIHENPELLEDTP